MFGFDHSSIHVSGGSGNLVQGNSDTGIEVFDSSFNLIGGAHPSQGNTGGIIQIDRASDNVVVGNTTTRLRVLGGGSAALATNNRIGGTTLGERNFIRGFGTMDEHGVPGGFAVQLAYAAGTIIENNWIGTTPDGMQQGDANTTAGICFDTENCSTPIRNNRIAGILALAVPSHGQPYHVGAAISLWGAGSGVSIVGNKIGLNADGQPVLGSVTGPATVH
jgi:hypothetical protein